MFTVFAILFTALGIPLMMHGSAKQITRLNHIGGYCLLIAGILWACVFLSLLAQGIGWLWGNAP